MKQLCDKGKGRHEASGQTATRFRPIGCKPTRENFTGTDISRYFVALILSGRIERFAGGSSNLLRYDFLSWLAHRPADHFSVIGVLRNNRIGNDLKFTSLENECSNVCPSIKGFTRLPSYIATKLPKISFRELKIPSYRKVGIWMWNESVRANGPIMPNVSLIMNEAGKPLVRVYRWYTTAVAHPAITRCMRSTIVLGASPKNGSVPKAVADPIRAA